MTRLVIYTVLTGAKEALGDPLSELAPDAAPSDLEIDWVCFTDNPKLSSPRWQMRLLQEPLPPERSSRRPKCLPHEYLGDWDFSLYIDNIVRFRRLPSSAELGLHEAPLLRAFKHNTRRDPVGEADAIVQLGYESVENLTRQLDFYKSRKLMDGIEQLSTCTLLLRSHHHSKIRELGRLWWEQFLHFGKRDQMSFDVALRLSGVQMDYWPGLKSDCDWLVNVSNVNNQRVLANFDAPRYRWRYRQDPAAQADPRQHYMDVGRFDGRNHARRVEILDWLCYRLGSSLGGQVPPRRNVASALETWLLPKRLSGASSLLVGVVGGKEVAAFSEAELEAASKTFGTYMAPQRGEYLQLTAADLQSGQGQVQDNNRRYELVVILGPAGHELPQSLRLVGPTLIREQGLLVLGLRSPAEAQDIAAAQALLQAELGAGVLVQASIHASQHDDLDMPLRNSLLAFAWQGQASTAAQAPAALASSTLPQTTASDTMNAAPAKKLFIAYCTSGLGNRLRPLASALAYCKATGRDLKVYWDDVTPNGCLTPWSDLFTNRIEPISLEEIAALDATQVALFTEKGPGHGVEREATRHERPQLQQLVQRGASLNPSQALRLDESAEVVIVYDNDYLQALPLETSIDALRQLNPQPAIRARVMATSGSLGLKPVTPAVHARGTDFNMKEALVTYTALIDERIPSGDFFLSTEDAELEQGLRERYGARLKSRPDRLHLQLNPGKTSWNEPDSYTISRAHGVDALIDIYLLSSVQLVVYHPGSTFAEIARHLHGLLQGLPAPKVGGADPVAAPAPSPPGQALADAKARFARTVQGLMPRGGAAHALDIDAGAAGPLAPEQLPPSFFYWETLGYRIPLLERLFMSTHSSQPELSWDGAVFNQLLDIPFERFSPELFQRICPYPEAWSQMAAMRGYIKGKKVLVIGSETYWIELLCAMAGAAAVTTVEYRPIRWSQPPRVPLQTLTWDAFVGDLGGHAEGYDLVLSYSSLEHSGLGRYGDRLSPLGDLFTFQLMAQCMKPTGLCAVAVPTGQDLTHFNAHRIYGVQRIRALESVSSLKYLGIVFPDAHYLASDPVEALRTGWTLPALAGLPLGQYRQPILCFAQEGFSPERYRAG